MSDLSKSIFLTDGEETPKKKKKKNKKDKADQNSTLDTTQESIGMFQHTITVHIADQNSTLDTTQESIGRKKCLHSK